MYVIGIDLGTTYSCVAVLKNDKVEIIPNAEGKNTTPSYVAFTENERIIGFEAKNQCGRNPKNTVYDVKRLIGRRFNDESVTSDRKNWSFDVVPDGDEPMISVEFKHKRSMFSPVEISAMILGNMKQIAENYLGEEVKDAVITIPAYYDTSQRQATKDAARIAGLNVLKIISEPTAAAIAYGLINNIVDERNVLIYDLGGGTSDVSVAKIKNGEITVKSKAGDTHLGGEDFDNRIVDHFITEFQREHKMDIRKNKRAIARLRARCEQSKWTLSTTQKTSVELDCLHKGKDLNTKITRKQFEELNDDLFQLTITHVKKCLQEAGIDRENIDDVVLVGGSTRIPRVQELLQDFFNGKQLNKSINPDEVVAYGAAYQAANLIGNRSKIVQDLQVIDVVPLSLGTDESGTQMSVIIPRNTPIPTKQTQTYSTIKDNQSSISIAVFEGESPIVSENTLLGRFVLRGITPKPCGVPIIEVTFEIDSNGILHVSAVDRDGKSHDRITISGYIGRLTEAEINRMIVKAERYKEDDNEQRERVEARNELESYVNGLKSRMRELGPGNRRDRDEVINMCEETLSWIEGNQSAEEVEFNRRRRRLELKCRPIIIRLTDMDD